MGYSLSLDTLTKLPYDLDINCDDFLLSGDCLTKAFIALDYLNRKNILEYEVYCCLKRDSKELSSRIVLSFHAWLQTKENVIDYGANIISSREDLFLGYFGEINCAPTELREIYENGKKFNEEIIMLDFGNFHHNVSSYWEKMLSN